MLLMPRSIRGRLTLWLTLLITLCMAAFALYLYLTVTATLTGNLEQTLRVEAQQVAATFDVQGPNGNSDGAGQAADIGAVDGFSTAGLFIETFDTHGHPLARSSNLGRLHLPDESRAASLIGAGSRLSTQAVPGDALRVYSVPASRDGQIVGLVLVATSLHDVTTAARTLLALLIAGGLAVVLLAALGGLALVRRGLRPLDRMAAVAEGITARRLDQRLALRAPPVEVERLAHTFDAMLDRLHESFAAQRRFVADASHDLRTPLATLHGRSEVLLLRPTLDDETRAGLAMMRDEAARMGRMVANLLVLARGDEDRPIDRRPVELDVLLLEVAGQAHALARGVRVTLAHEDQALVLGDRDLLKQALLNLVDNALAHTPPGGSVALSLRVADGQAYLSVRDSGAGIAPDDLPRIFERFYRVDPARSRRSGGAGLGLSIVRWVAEAHGGQATAASTVGVGSTFTIMLPLSNQVVTVP